ncbi:hypothetical protein [Mycolicibacterium sp.]|uniref:hypothetical protein n=1 Tax=Mycolicibacterium sp. TaxID=2320850 RepID=UPI001A3210D3|nr:hypothetical protein [Mycolicibacterium sp.]MBJ7337244.1 hypothetical protein [Mycolicibacterium sp.]
MAMEKYVPGEDPPPPQRLRNAHSQYQHWRAEAQQLHVPDADDARVDANVLELSELKLKDTDDLREIIDDADLDTDVLELTTAARVYIKRLHDRLMVNSLWGPNDFALTGDDAVAACESICVISERVIDELIWPRREELAIQVRRNCAAIIDHTVDARRLLSRDGERQYAELYLLLKLRRKDAQLTKSVRTEAGRAMVDYNITHTDALMTGRADAAAENELKATESLLETLTGCRAFAIRDDVYRLSAGAPPSNAVASAKLIEVAARLASYLVAYAPTPTSPGIFGDDVERGDEFRERILNCAKTLREVIDPDLDPSVTQDRADVISLLTAARRPDFVVNPPTALRILRFRGIGEMLVARMLTTIATGESSHDNHYSATDYLRTGSSPELRPSVTDRSEERRRIKLMERAGSLYQRAIDWQRSAGAPKTLRQLAITELDDLQKVLARSTTPYDTDDEETPDPQNIEQAITRLRADLDQMIVQGILWADLRHLNELRDDSAVRAIRLINTMTEATRFLKQPEVGLRTDLSPT